MTASVTFIFIARASLEPRADCPFEHPALRWVSDIFLSPSIGTFSSHIVDTVREKVPRKAIRRWGARYKVPTSRCVTAAPNILACRGHLGLWMAFFCWQPQCIWDLTAPRPSPVAHLCPGAKSALLGHGRLSASKRQKWGHGLKAGRCGGNEHRPC
jgi:hypothetical protein